MGVDVASVSTPMTLAAASKHIKVLERAGLVRREVRWRTHVCRLEAGPLKQAADEIGLYERFWTDRLDALQQLLREDDTRRAAQSAKGEVSRPSPFSSIISE